MKVDLIKNSSVAASSVKYTGPAVARIVGDVNPNKEALAKVYGPQKDEPVYSKAWQSGDKYQIVSFMLEFEASKKTKMIEFQLEDKLIGSADGTKVMLMNEWGDILYPMDEATFKRLKAEGNKQVTEFCTKCTKSDFKDFYKLRRGEDALVTFLQKYLQFRPKARIKNPDKIQVKWLDICDGNYKQFFDKLHKGDVSGLVGINTGDKENNKVGVQFVVEVSKDGKEYEKISTVKDGFYEHWVSDGGANMKKHYDYQINDRGVHPETLARWSETFQPYESAKCYKMIPANAEDIFGGFDTAADDDDLPF